VTRRPDLILFMTDQQRYDQVGYASNGHFSTPNLDRLAAAGVVFEHAYSASTVCVPARSSLLTGLLPHRLPTQVNRFALREGFWTVARALRQAGYETALIGKMHFAPVRADHGFETMRLCEHLNAQGVAGAHSGELVDDYHEWLVGHGYDDWRFEDGQLRQHVPAGTFPHDAAVHPTGWIERETARFLTGRDRDRPLFLIVSFPHPHAPYNPAEPYASRYSPADPMPPRTGFEVNESLPPLLRDAMTTFGGRPTPRVDPHRPGPVHRYVAFTRALVQHIDDALGRIVDQLDLADTVVFFTSDHGDYAGNRGLMRKTPWIPFDDLARVALIAAGARVLGGRRVGHPVQSSDLVLTCLDLAGAPAPDIDFDTRSLLPFMTGNDPPEAGDRAVFCGTNLGWAMARRGHHKYFHQRGQGVGALFDLEQDPQETIDLLDHPTHRAVGEELRSILDRRLRLGVPSLPVLA
jgi:arylsulfatase